MPTSAWGSPLFDQAEIGGVEATGRTDRLRGRGSSVSSGLDCVNRELDGAIDSYSTSCTSDRFHRDRERFVLPLSLVPQYTRKWSSVPPISAGVSTFGQDLVNLNLHAQKTSRMIYKIY